MFCKIIYFIFYHRQSPDTESDEDWEPVERHKRCVYVQQSTQPILGIPFRGESKMRMGTGCCGTSLFHQQWKSTTGAWVEWTSLMPWSAITKSSTRPRSGTSWTLPLWMPSFFTRLSLKVKDRYQCTRRIQQSIHVLTHCLRRRSKSLPDAVQGFRIHINTIVNYTETHVTDLLCSRVIATKQKGFRCNLTKKKKSYVNNGCNRHGRIHSR